MLGGGIPDEWGDLTSLTNLDIQHNDLDGKITFEIGDLVNLVSLRFNSNKMTGNIPTSVERLVRLEELKLGTLSLLFFCCFIISALSSRRPMYNEGRGKKVLIFFSFFAAKFLISDHLSLFF